jgi:hypothetical protein
VFVSVVAIMLTHSGIPLNIPALNRMNPIFAVTFPSIAIVVLLVEMSVVSSSRADGRFLNWTCARRNVPSRKRKCGFYGSTSRL